MVGIVVVSHSAALARAAVGLATEMVHGARVRIALAAGLDEHTFGTDATRIVEAIAEADDGGGVVVLMDLGSAVLSAELALELLDDEARARVTLCPAPLVEGLVVAAVTAAGGADRAEVATEAAAALAGKQAQLGVAGEPAGATAGPQDAAAGAPSTATGTFEVTIAHGLHARPAARLVQLVRAASAGNEVQLVNLSTGAGPVPASSLSKVATLGALAGHRVEVTARGPDADRVLADVLALAGRGFDDSGPAPAATAPTTTAPTTTAPPASTRPGGVLPASPGAAIGPVRHVAAQRLEVPDARTQDPARDRAELQRALATTRGQLQRLLTRATADLGAEHAAIFEAHLLLLDDPALLDDVHARIDGGQAAAPAWAAATGQTAAELAALPDPYLQARAADVRGVADQVLHALLGVGGTRPGGPGGPAPAGVLVAEDLSPAQAAELVPSRVDAVLLAGGSPTSHAVILVRGKGIPAVVGAGPAVLELPEGTTVAVDGGTGEVLVDPDEAQQADWRERAEQQARRRDAALGLAAARAVTRDGTPVEVAANIATATDAAAAAAGGADSAGLVRTELLFLDRQRAPDVDEQVQAYLELAQALGGRRLTLRTLDVGGDKPLAYLPLPAEANPFLGVRGLRLGLARPDLLATQLLAMVRVAHLTPVSIMFPMVARVDEVLAARAALDRAITAEGRGTPPGLEVGIMIEIPAAALKAASFAPHVDFFSVGTNDLTQYTLAAERGNDAVARIGDPFDPGVLALIGALCRGAGSARVAVCGELAADVRATAILLGLGVRELSVAPRAVAEVKQAARAVELPAARELAGRALTAAGPEEVRLLVRESTGGEAPQL